MLLYKICLECSSCLKIKIKQFMHKSLKPICRNKVNLGPYYNCSAKHRTGETDITDRLIIGLADNGLRYYAFFILSVLAYFHRPKRQIQIYMPACRYGETF